MSLTLEETKQEALKQMQATNPSPNATVNKSLVNGIALLHSIMFAGEHYLSVRQEIADYIWDGLEEENKQ